MLCWVALFSINFSSYRRKVLFSKFFCDALPRGLFFIKFWFPDYRHSLLQKRYVYHITNQELILSSIFVSAVYIRCQLFSIYCNNNRYQLVCHLVVRDKPSLTII